MISDFKGFRGTCAMAQVGKIQFCLLAKNPKQLQAIWTALVKEAGPLEPEMCKRSILIEASVLPAIAPKKSSTVIPT